MGDKRKKRPSRRATSFVMPYSITKCRDRLHEGIREGTSTAKRSLIDDLISAPIHHFFAVFDSKSDDRMDFAILEYSENREGKISNIPRVQGTFESLVDKSTEISFKVGHWSDWIMMFLFACAGVFFLALTPAKDFICLGPCGILPLMTALTLIGVTRARRQNYRKLMFHIFRIPVYGNEPRSILYTLRIGIFGAVASTIFLLFLPISLPFLAAGIVSKGISLMIIFAITAVLSGIVIWSWSTQRPYWFYNWFEIARKKESHE